MYDYEYATMWMDNLTIIITHITKVKDFVWTMILNMINSKYWSWAFRSGNGPSHDMSCPQVLKQLDISYCSVVDWHKCSKLFGHIAFQHIITN